MVLPSQNPFSGQLNRQRGLRNGKKVDHTCVTTCLVTFGKRWGAKCVFWWDLRDILLSLHEHIVSVGPALVPQEVNLLESGKNPVKIRRKK